jgi:tripartite-type tricarboxylate transporter receptor subunit TctC
LREKPGALTYASSGNGSPAHLTAELFKMATKTDVAHVAYRGSAPAMQDLAAKNHPFMFETLSSIKPLVDSGRLRAIAIASKKRSRLSPELPTLAELGVPRVTGGTWNMIFVPAGTSAAIVDKLNSAFNAAVSNKEVSGRLAELAIEAISDSTPASAGSFLRDETKRWAVVVKESGAKVE